MRFRMLATVVAPIRFTTRSKSMTLVTNVVSSASTTMRNLIWERKYIVSLHNNVMMQNEMAVDVPFLTVSKIAFTLSTLELFINLFNLSMTGHTAIEPPTVFLLDFGYDKLDDNSPLK